MTPSSKTDRLDKAVRQPRNSGGQPVKRQKKSSGRAERHLGATEEQVSVTMPPRPEDDEPKQG